MAGERLDPPRWVERHGDYLYRFALAKVRRGEVAEELVQEALLAAWAGRERFAGRATERSWLVAILKRKVVDWLRKTVRERGPAAAEKDAWTAEQFTRSGKWDRPPAEWDRDGPTGKVERDEFWQVVTACVEKLPPRFRDPFVLWHLADKSGEEICRAIELTPTNLWVILHRARLRMYECLSANWYGGER